MSGLSTLVGGDDDDGGGGGDYMQRFSVLLLTINT